MDLLVFGSGCAVLSDAGAGANGIGWIAGLPA